MKTILFSELAFDVCALLGVASKEDRAAPTAHQAEAVALTEAEMDMVAGGAGIIIVGEEKYGGWGGEW